MGHDGRLRKVLDLTGRVGNVAVIVLEPTGRVGVVLFLSSAPRHHHCDTGANVPGLRFGAVLIVLPSLPVSRTFRNNILRQYTLHSKRGTSRTKLYKSHVPYAMPQCPPSIISQSPA
jgi:hypothetical protein